MDLHIAYQKQAVWYGILASTPTMLPNQTKAGATHCLHGQAAAAYKTQINESPCHCLVN